MGTTNLTLSLRTRIAMHLTLFFLVLAAANGVAVNQSKAVRDYLDRLVSVSKNIILNELMGPTVGSDVSLYPPPIDVDQPPRSALTFPFFFNHSQGSSFPSSPIQNTPNTPYTGSGMVVASITHGSTNSLFPVHMAAAIPRFYARW